jgi:hypothetical protein
MSPEKVWAALERYDRELASHGVAAAQFTPVEYETKGDDLSRRVVLAHCRWMAKKCLTTFRAEYEAARAAAAAGGFGITRCVELMEEAFSSLGKAMRWLCYIQGVCHVLGLYTCNELRDHSRGDAGEFKPAAEEHGTPAAAPPAEVIRYDDCGEEPGVIAAGPVVVPPAVRNVFEAVVKEYGPEMDVMKEIRNRPSP